MIRALQPREATPKRLCEYGECSKWATVDEGTPLCTRHALLQKQKKPSKYRNVKTTTLGVKFHSKREAQCWPGLLLRLKSGQIRDLSRQNTYELHVNGIHICDYRSDFEWNETADTESGTTVHIVADAKGFRTREYQIKKRLMSAIYGIDILEL